MNVRNAAYWGATSLLSLALAASGMGALTRQPFLVDAMLELGYPLYIMGINGTWYVAAAVAVALPGLPWIKEWAYAGIAFAMTGALASHASVGHPLTESIPAFSILTLAFVSYVLRPASRRLVIDRSGAGVAGSRKAIRRDEGGQVATP